MHPHSTVSPTTQRLVQVNAIVDRIAGVNGPLVLFHFLLSLSVSLAVNRPLEGFGSAPDVHSMRTDMKVLYQILH